MRPIGPATFITLNKTFNRFFGENILANNFLLNIFFIMLTMFLFSFLNPIFIFLNIFEFFILLQIFLPIFEPSPSLSWASGVGLFLLFACIFFCFLSSSSLVESALLVDLPPAILTRICMFCLATLTSLAMEGKSKKFFAMTLSIAPAGVIFFAPSLSEAESKTLLLIESVREFGNIFNQRMNMIQQNLYCMHPQLKMVHLYQLFRKNYLWLVHWLLHLHQQQNLIFVLLLLTKSPHLMLHH